MIPSLSHHNRARHFDLIHAIRLLCLMLASVATTSQAADSIDFVRDVQPILQEHCYRCHGDEKQKSGLRLDIKSEAFRGGDGYGPSIVAGQVSDSPLMELVTSDDPEVRMPPGDQPLPASQISFLRRWIDSGANWPDGVDVATLEDRTDHWSFQPLSAIRPPQTQPADWPRGAIDSFILAQLREQSLHPSPESDRRTWLRRSYLDLIGIPPSPEQLQAFLSDQSANAFERVVDQLLASPRYGERWAQHWLDVVRYADTDGFEVNTERANAWPYRDYVIAAFNADLPYDQFIRQQLAGDALGADAATGFLVTAAALLPGQIGKDDQSKRLARQDELNEVVINTGEALLGLSIGCARCHDHKFDAITQRDYYAMQAFFSGVRYGERPLGGSHPDAEQKVFAGIFTTPEPTFLLSRGDPEQPGEPIAPRVITALGNVALDFDADEQPRRRALADWIADPTNPLTARVMVNRVWQYHFGTGLVETASDFGRSGARPTHPDLLDWLATRFIQSGWSIKSLHRMIVLSATYRQSNLIDAVAQQMDAEDRWLWRFPTRRLEAEAIRDSMLAVSGQLNLEVGGPGFDLYESRGGLNGFPPLESFSAAGLRRMIYAHKIRMEREIVFGAFDCPDAGQSTPRRRQSTTPIQALNMFNSQFTIDQAAAFARRLVNEAGHDPADQIRLAYRIALSREADQAEIRRASEVAQMHGLPTVCRAIFNSNEFLFLP
jgi:hypothetical protein